MVAKSPLKSPSILLARRTMLIWRAKRRLALRVPRSLLPRLLLRYLSSPLKARWQGFFWLNFASQPTFLSLCCFSRAGVYVATLGAHPIFLLCRHWGTFFIFLRLVVTFREEKNGTSLIFTCPAGLGMMEGWV